MTTPSAPAPPPVGRIVYASFATPRHSGGVQVMSEHVQLLSGLGHAAWLWLPTPTGRPGWIDPALPVLNGPTLALTADDLLVLPEVPLVPGRDPAPGVRKVIFNQNHFYTYAATDPGSESGYPGWTPRPAVWTVSEESRDVLAALTPELPVSLIPNTVDSALFRPAPTPVHGVAWFPRKRPREASLLGQLLATDPRFAGVERYPLLNTTRARVVEVLGAVRVFISLGHTESFGLPVAEALSAGCLIVGYDGGGGHELFRAPGVWRVPDQRPLLLLDRLADVLARATELAPLAAANRAWLRERYGPARTAAALDTAVGHAFARPGAAATATHPAAWLEVLGPNFTAYA